ncbi:MAG: adaptor protein MecA [Eubacteriales bacterium]|nr:adaptor protein MecA [Eubacteriales bacterium]
MKIEKLNENQIRCTLTREDLISRKLKLSELAYGTEKAKSLFREMMQQAALEFGFEANDIPLMIEAIPMSTESIMLIITKVEDPDELDTRFAKFAPSDSEDEEPGSFSSLKLEGADDILNLFQRIRDAQKALAQKPEASSDTEDAEQQEAPVDLAKIFAFGSLDDVIHAAAMIHGNYTGDNSLYKNTSVGEYQLLIHKSEHTPEEFNRICNMISEYGDTRKYTAGSEAYLIEHGQRIVEHEAIQRLASLN